MPKGRGLTANLDKRVSFANLDASPGAGGSECAKYYSLTFGSKEHFYTPKIDNKDVMWYNKKKR